MKGLIGGGVGTLIGGGVGTLAVLVLIACGFSSVYTIDEGERGVVLQNGRIKEVSAPGLHFKTPFIDSVHDISIRSSAAKFSGLAYTKDQQTTKFVISVNFHIPTDKVQELYSRYQNIDNLVGRFLERVVPTAVKNVFGRYNAHSAIQDRVNLISDIQNALIETAKDEPITIEAVQVEDIEFSKAYEQSIENRMKVEVEVATQRQELEKTKVHAEIQITQAKANAEVKLATAKAEAEAIKLKGEAEASAIKARSEALKSNPNLVALTAAERWDGILPQAMLPNGSIPMIGINTNGEPIKELKDKQ